VVEEGAELLRAPDLHLRCHALGEIGRSGDVAGDIAPTHGVSERGMQGAVDVADRLGSKAAASLAMPGFEQSSIEGGELCRRQPLEREVPQGGDDVPLDVLPVAEPGGRTDPWWAHGREPLLHQEPGNGSLGGFDERARPQRREGVVEGLLALFLGPEAAFAVLATLAGRGVRHVEVPGIGTAALI